MRKFNPRKPQDNPAAIDTQNLTTARASGVKG
jgi:hypothetical protein